MKVLSKSKISSHSLSQKKDKNDKPILLTPFKKQNKGLQQTTADERKDKQQKVADINQSELFRKNLHFQNSGSNKSVSEIYSDDKYASKSPFSKTCFSGLRRIIPLAELKQIHQKNSSFRYKTNLPHNDKQSNKIKYKQLQVTQKPQKYLQQPKDQPNLALQSRNKSFLSLVHPIHKPSALNATPTCYPSVTIMMKKKLTKQKPKNIRDKLPVNILATAQAIQQKQKDSQLQVESQIQQLREI